MCDCTKAIIINEWVTFDGRKIGVARVCVHLPCFINCELTMGFGGVTNKCFECLNLSVSWLAVPKREFGDWVAWNIAVGADNFHAAVASKELKCGWQEQFHGGRDAWNEWLAWAVYSELERERRGGLNSLAFVQNTHGEEHSHTPCVQNWSATHTRYTEHTQWRKRHSL
jgi:hypothetical protein